MDSLLAEGWEGDFERWLEPFLARLRRKAKRCWGDPFSTERKAMPEALISEFGAGVPKHLRQRMRPSNVVRTIDRPAAW